MDRTSLSLRAALLQSVGEEEETALPEQPQAAGKKFMGDHQFKAGGWTEDRDIHSTFLRSLCFIAAFSLCFSVRS